MLESSDTNVELILIVVVLICDDDAGDLDHLTDVRGELYAFGRDKLDLFGGSRWSRHVVQEELDFVTIIVLLYKTSRERDGLTNLLACGGACVDKAEDDHSEDQHDSAHDVTLLLWSRVRLSKRPMRRTGYDLTKMRLQVGSAPEICLKASSGAPTSQALTPTGLQKHTPVRLQQVSGCGARLSSDVPEVS
jgi:hypothetical protein